MTKEKKGKRSRSRSKDRKRGKDENNQRFTDLEKRIANLTSVVTKLVQLKNVEENLEKIQTTNVLGKNINDNK